MVFLTRVYIPQRLSISTCCSMQSICSGLGTEYRNWVSEGGHGLWPLYPEPDISSRTVPSVLRPALFITLLIPSSGTVTLAGHLSSAVQEYLIEGKCLQIMLPIWLSHVTFYSALESLILNSPAGKNRQVCQTIPHTGSADTPVRGHPRNWMSSLRAGSAGLNCPINDGNLNSPDQGLLRLCWICISSLPDPRSC